MHEIGGWNAVKSLSCVISLIYNKIANKKKLIMTFFSLFFNNIPLYKGKQLYHGNLVFFFPIPST